ncbi:hypothetical protein D3C77_806700 [compost metagenome]
MIRVEISVFALVQMLFGSNATYEALAFRPDPGTSGVEEHGEAGFIQGRLDVECGPLAWLYR